MKSNLENLTERAEYINTVMPFNTTRIFYKSDGGAIKVLSRCRNESDVIHSFGIYHNLEDALRRFMYHLEINRVLPIDFAIDTVKNNYDFIYYTNTDDLYARLKMQKVLNLPLLDIFTKVV